MKIFLHVYLQNILLLHQEIVKATYHISKRQLVTALSAMSHAVSQTSNAYNVIYLMHSVEIEGLRNNMKKSCI